MKSLPRKIEAIIEPEPVIEGAGVRLNRSSATRRLDYLDPFLLLDHFASSNPRDYQAGFQLWVNLPAKLKMIKPRYQDIRSAEIPEIKKDNGARIRVITGTVDGVSGPVTGIAANPIYLDVFVPAHASLVQPIHRGHTAFAYVFEGEAKFAGEEKEDGTMVSHSRIVVLGA